MDLARLDGFRGSAFINLAVETAFPDSAIHALAKRHNDWILGNLLEHLSLEVFADPERLARRILVLWDGGLVGAYVQQSDDPIRTARDASPFAWRGVLAGYTSGMSLALATGVVAIATLLPVFWAGSVGLFMSAGLFGLAVFVGPGSVTNFSKKNLPQQMWGKSVSLFTLVFAVCQTVGPVEAGWLIDATADIQHSLVFAGAVLAAGAAVSATQKPLAGP